MCANEIEEVAKLVSEGVGELGVGLSSDNVEVNVAAPQDGNVKFTVFFKIRNELNFVKKDIRFAACREFTAYEFPGGPIV